jgi:hypothetical protein
MVTETHRAHDALRRTATGKSLSSLMRVARESVAASIRTPDWWRQHPDCLCWARNAILLLACEIVQESGTSASEHSVCRICMVPSPMHGCLSAACPGDILEAHMLSLATVDSVSNSEDIRVAHGSYENHESCRPKPCEKRCNGHASGRHASGIRFLLLLILGLQRFAATFLANVLSYCRDAVYFELDTR